MGIINNAWDEILKEEFSAEYFYDLNEFLDLEYKEKTIYPAKKDIYNAFKLTPPESVKVVILGQDPYINEGQAHGLALSVLPGMKIPPSLKNMYKELYSDLQIPISSSGDLTKWAKQGVLLLNTVLTVEAGKSASHFKKGWERFTDSAIKYLNGRGEPIVFILWGNPAQKKEVLIINPQHLILKSVHPSPLSANRGFFGSKPYSKVNAFLKKNNIKEIDWKLD